MRVGPPHRSVSFKPYFVELSVCGCRSPLWRADARNPERTVALRKLLEAKGGLDEIDRHGMKPYDRATRDI